MGKTIDVGQYGLRMNHIPIRLPQFPCPCRVLMEKNIRNIVTGGWGGGRQGHSISIPSIERPQAYVRKYCVRHVPAPLPQPLWLLTFALMERGYWEPPSGFFQVVRKVAIFWHT